MLGIEMTRQVIWIVLVIILITIEIITLGVTTIWFACGALIAFIVSLLFDSVIAEIIIFLISSFIMLVFTKPIVIKYLNPERVRTNYDRNIGKEGVVIADIDNLEATGRVIISGQEWMARASNDEEVIKKDSKVLIEKIEGAKLIVTKIKK